jgi:protein NrfD
MNELVITRNNHLIEPSLHIWGWEVPVYLFLGGLVAGILIIAGYFIVTKKHLNENSSLNFLPYLGIVLLSLGMGSLFMDLEHKLYVWRMYTTFQWWSPMSWGSWILIFVYPILILIGLIKVPPMLGGLIPALKKISIKINEPKILKTIGILAIGFGALLGLYTGVLLSAFGARPAWNSAMLWMLFLTSGLSAAAALIHMIAKDKSERELLAKSDNVLLIIEFVLIILYLVGLLTASQASIDAAMLLINGKYAATFWIFIVGLGIIIPLIIQLSAVTHKIKHTPIGPILVLFGGLMLRFIIVSVGQYSHWSSAVLK